MDNLFKKINKPNKIPALQFNYMYNLSIVLLYQFLARLLFN